MHTANTLGKEPVNAVEKSVWTFEQRGAKKKSERRVQHLYKRLYHSQLVDNQNVVFLIHKILFKIPVFLCKQSSTAFFFQREKNPLFITDCCIMSITIEDLLTLDLYSTN